MQHEDDLTPAVPEAETPTAAEVPAPTNRRGAATVLIAIVVLLIGFFGYVAMAPKGKAADGTLPMDPVGYEVPDVRFPRLDGKGELGLRDYTGNVLVINFWASWCGPCKDEAAILADAEKRWRDQGVVFIGIDSEDKDVDAKAFEQKYGIEYASIVDNAGVIRRDWSVTGYPETFFVGKDGRIVSKWISNIDAVSLNKSIEAALAA